MALLSTISGSENVSLTKINATINTVNGFAYGEDRQKLMSTGGDFNVLWVEDSIRNKSTTSKTLSALNLGDTIGLTVIGQYLERYSNSYVICYSESNPLNYVIGQLTSGTDFSSVFFNIVKISGTATVTDWIIVPYNLTPQYTLFSGTDTSSNDLISSWSITDFTLNSYSIQAIKFNDIVTLTGNISLTAIGTGTSQFHFVLNTNYLLDNSTLKYFSGSADKDYSTPLVCTVSNDIGITYNNRIGFEISPSSVTGSNYHFNFSFSYKCANKYF